MNREIRSFRCLMVIFVALLTMGAGLAQETTTTTTGAGGEVIVESVRTTESSNVNLTEVTEQPVAGTRVTVAQTGVAAVPGENQTVYIVGGLVILALICLMALMAGKRRTSVDVVRTTEYRR